MPLGLGLKNSIPIELGQHHDLAGMIGGTGRYASLDTTSALDEFTGITVTILISSRLSDGGGHGGQWIPFSCYYTDGSGNEHGIYFWKYDQNLYYGLGYGAATEKSGVIAMDSFYKSPPNNARKGGYLNYITFTATAASTTDNILFSGYNHMGAATSSPTTIPLQTEDDLDFTNWGTLGTNSEIRIGNKYNGTSTTYNISENESIHRVQLWNSVLSQTELEKTIRFNSDDDYISPVRYSVGSYTQPLHEWIPVLGNTTTIPDTGSGTALNLEIKGTADVGFYNQN